MEQLVLDRIVGTSLIKPPVLGSGHLQREHVVAVEMGSECLTRLPGTIEIGGTLGAEGSFQTTYDRQNTRMQRLDLVQQDCGSLAQELYDAFRIRLIGLVAVSIHRADAVVGRRNMPGIHYQLKRFGRPDVHAKDLVQPIPIHHRGELVRFASDV